MCYGVGYNDADYAVSKREKINGKVVQCLCPYYSRWRDMLFRAYSNKHVEKYPTYKGVTVCDEWLTFSNFKIWMEKQNWENKCLDKDLLFYGNKVYSPDTCIFISNEVNTLLVKSDGSRGDWPLGVRYTRRSKGMINERSKPYSSQITNRRKNKKYTHLGYFSTPKEAHKCWQLNKCDLILEVADCYDRSSIEYEVLLKAWDRIYDDYVNDRETI
ncbi:hypothetical protein BNNNBJKE_00060 [Aeromonas phage vB_AdhM_DL]|nr:hypothetical protein BNCALIDO_00116 [Aeromonas phage vB_AdhM_TS9]WBF79644.1 hypothetical protein BNNNBJKE_00060 [Aeromonas phage vB_AdhM_DL]